MINADLVTLEIENQSGGISFSGSLNPDESHSISTTYGDIYLALPAESAFDVLLETTYGTIETEFQLTLIGAIDAQEMQGMINQGGPHSQSPHRTAASKSIFLEQSTIRPSF